jgi:hypothetical protein
MYGRFCLMSFITSMRRMSYLRYCSQ